MEVFNIRCQAKSKCPVFRSGFMQSEVTNLMFNFKFNTKFVGHCYALCPFVKVLILLYDAMLYGSC